jgi:hypothetical protein
MSNPNGSAVMADRDELARVVLRQIRVVIGREPQADDDEPFIDWHLIGYACEMADAILASDWLARVRADEREAWKQLALAAIDCVGDACRETNWGQPTFGPSTYERLAAQQDELLHREAIAAAIRERNQ